MFISDGDRISTYGSAAPFGGCICISPSILLSGCIGSLLRAVCLGIVILWSFGARGSFYFRLLALFLLSG